MSPDRPEALGVLLLVVDALDAAGIAYHVGGSYASSVHGTPRQTQDIDIVVEIDATKADALVTALGSGFYADAAAAREAVAQRDSFNLIHLDSGIKVDLFVRGETPFDRSEFERRREEVIDPESGREVFVKSAEDTILRKLLWYRSGGEASDRQWLDACGVVRAQGDGLDSHYLRSWGRRLGIEDLVERALGGEG